MKVNKTQEEILENFREQISLLDKACERYDDGEKLEIINVATRLRVMLHQTRKSTSLFTHLGIGNIEMYNVATENNPNNLYVEHNLVDIIFSQNMRYKFKDNIEGKKILKKWWDQEIVLSEKDLTFTRKNLILYVSNTDGGAHVDEKIDKGYQSFKKGDATGVFGNVNGNNVLNDKDIIYTSIRAIAFEVLSTINQKYEDIPIKSIRKEKSNKEETTICSIRITSRKKK